MNKKGRRLSRETGLDQVGFEGFPEGCDRGLFLIWKGKEFQKAGA